MSDEKNLALAKTVFNSLCECMDHKEMNYQKDEEKLAVHFEVAGDDIPMVFIVAIDEKRQLIRLLSMLPFEMAEDKRIDGAIATCVANFPLVDGNFDYDISSGKSIFRLTASFRESLIGEELFFYMIGYACAAVDEYNDKFLAISKGMLDIADFVESTYDSIEG